MPEIALFVEDTAHKAFLDALINRMANERGISVSLDWKNARHGHPAVARELTQFLRDLRRGRKAAPDLVVAATDANCKGPARRKEIADILDQAGLPNIAAIPEPHIERWLLLDSRAFKGVFGRGCDAPDGKCERSRYKKALIDSIRNAGMEPTFGGTEFTGDLVDCMDLDWLERNDASLGRLLADLRTAFEGWKPR